LQSPFGFASSIENNCNNRRKKGTWHIMEVKRRDEKQEPERRLRIVQMSGEPAPTKTSERSHALDTRLQGRWLLLARGIWITLVVLSLGTFFTNLPVYMARKQTLCAGTECASGALLTPSQAEVLKGIGLSLGDYAAYTVAFTLATIVVYLVVSMLIIWRRPDDRMAVLVALMLVTLGTLDATSTVAASSSPWRVLAACLVFLALALFVLVFLLFPTGQFVPSFTRWIAVVCLAVLVPATFFPNNPFAQNPDALLLFYFVSLVAVATLALVQLYRYRRVSSPLQRQQTKWVVFGLAVPCSVLVGGYGLSTFPALGDPSAPAGASYQLAFAAIQGCTLLLIPLSFGFAMLRARLWDIDVLINRTLVYGALTVSLTGVYVGLVIGLSALLRGLIRQDNSVAIIISTLVIYALIGPLRIRIQRLIDRRFYRRKYDATKIVAAFSATLRRQVDLDQLREQLLAVVQETMQPANVSLWLRRPEQDGKQRAPWRATPPVPSEGR
jgi:hypothetical protein